MSPQVHPHTPRVAMACGCALGESALWDHRTGTLLWVDIDGGAIWRLRPETGESARLPVGETVGFVALTPDPEVVVAGLRRTLARLRLADGRRETLLTPEPDQPGNRLNGGIVGPDGALYFGTMNLAQEAPTGRFYRWDGTRLDAFGPQTPVTNGPALDPAGRTLYTVDTPGGTLHAHAVAAGTVGAGREVLRFAEGWGHPDGVAVDAEGHLWVCHYGGSRITRFTPDGTIDRTLPVPTALTTHCAFGGPDLTTLYVTTARGDRDPTIDPMAGHLFAVETGIRGLPSHVLAV